MASAPGTVRVEGVCVDLPDPDPSPPGSPGEALANAARNLHRAEECVGMDVCERFTAIGSEWINYAALLAQTADDA